jgi:1-deoxy-D-xylulose-5-phosphate reductoisomerase
MSIKIAVLGSTGSIGTTTVNIIKKNQKDFKVIFLSTNNNVTKIYQQAIDLKVKNVIIINKKKYLKYKHKFIKKKINVSHYHSKIKKIIKKKIDYTMCSISGLSGLKPTLGAINYSKTVGIANKESIICSWNIIKEKLKKNKTNFIPIDSEHFSIWSLINNVNKASIEEIILTASGGPFLNKSTKSLKNIKPKDAIKHPNWSMGKKISIDSTNLMNKVLEVIEAQRIFNIDKKKFKILIHPKSYIHAIIKFNNGLVKFLAHDTHMKIPIFNSIYFKKNKKIRSKQLNLKVLNNLELSKPNINQFPVLNILKMIPNKTSLFETILVSANDELVNCYLEGKIKYTDIYENLIKIIQMKAFKKYLFISPKNVDQISKLMKEVRLKCNDLCII